MFLKIFFVTLALLTVTSCQEYDDPDYGVFKTPAPTTKTTTTTTTTPEPDDITSAVFTIPVTDETSLRTKLENAKDCGSDSKCVAYYLCSENGEVVDDGSFLIDERMDGPKPSAKLPCPAMEFCCKKRNAQVPQEKDMCKSYEAPAKCGLRNVRGLGDPVKSIQGINQYAHYAEFPWLMAVSNESSFLGGGALIHPKVVLTAAHIMKHSTRADVRVRGGEYNTQTTEEICPHVEKQVQKVETHNKFNPNNLQNDVALLILVTPFKLTATINTICLPPPGMVFDGKKCVSSGWGKTNFDVKERHQVFPKVVTLPVIEHGECQTMFRDTRLGEDFILDKSFLCAGGEDGIDVCTGDGGSPLICESQHKGHWFVAGIVAGGLDCGQKDIPGFYAKVTAARPWIDKQMQMRGIAGATLT